MVAVAVGEQDGDERPTVTFHGRCQRFHVLAHADGRVDHHEFSIRVSDKIAVRVVRRWKRGGFDGDDFNAVSEKN